MRLPELRRTLRALQTLAHLLSVRQWQMFQPNVPTVVSSSLPGPFPLAYIPPAIPHRDEEGNLRQAEMKRLPCKCKYMEYEPFEEYRSICPYVLVTSKGPHTHPVPLPIKTPPAVRSQITSLLQDMNWELADMTPRSFLRHPGVKLHLQRLFPHHSCPTLSDLHISLANKEHLKTYIEKVKMESFPMGTSWQGNSRLIQRIERLKVAHKSLQGSHICTRKKKNFSPSASTISGATLMFHMKRMGKKVTMTMRNQSTRMGA